MHTLTSFHASAVQPEQLSGIMADYLALERARIFRRLLVLRFGLLALGAAIVGGVLHWLPPSGTWVTVGVFVVPPAWAWIVELRRDRRLARRLEEVPHKKVVKSS
jgi:Flp pilus assembly protein TadB